MGKWIDAATLLADLRSKPFLMEDEWDDVVRWVSATRFDSRSYLAGEVAAGLIRDRAPEAVKARFLTATDVDAPWMERLQDIVRSAPEVDVPAGTSRPSESARHAESV